MNFYLRRGHQPQAPQVNKSSFSSPPIVKFWRIMPLSNPRAKRGDGITKMAVRAAIVSRWRKDFGGAEGGVGGSPGGRRAEGLDRGSAAA